MNKKELKSLIRGLVEEAINKSQLNFVESEPTGKRIVVTNPNAAKFLEDLAEANIITEDGVGDILKNYVLKDSKSFIVFDSALLKQWDEYRGLHGFTSWLAFDYRSGRRPEFTTVTVTDDNGNKVKKDGLRIAHMGKDIIIESKLEKGWWNVGEINMHYGHAESNLLKDYWVFAPSATDQEVKQAFADQTGTKIAYVSTSPVGGF